MILSLFPSGDFQLGYFLQILFFSESLVRSGPDFVPLLSDAAGRIHACLALHLDGMSGGGGC